MTHEEFISLVKQPETVNAKHLSDLQEMIERYPYFAHAQLFYAKALQESNSVHFGANLKKTSLYCASRRWLYYYLHPEKKLSTQSYRRERNGKSSGEYFDMINGVESEGGDTKQSLKNLAERLKSARAMVVNLPEQREKENKAAIEINPVNKIKVVTVVSQDYFSLVEPEISEINAKKLILEKKYKDAVEILRRLNFNNPKKSVYFADQIRFLEKVIENSKK